MASWKKLIVSGGDAGTPSALVGTNISGTATNLTAGAVTNGVYTTGAQTIAGVKTFSSTIAGNISGSAATATSATTATTATNVVITDNENTSEANALVFVAGADIDGSTSAGLESDGDLTYHPGTGKLTSTQFSGALTGNVTGTATLAEGLSGSNLSGAITNSGNATTLSSDLIYESHLKCNSPTNGYVLTAASGEVSGFEWSAAAAAANDATLTMSTSSPLTGSDTFTANASSNTTFTVGIDDASTSAKGAVQLSDSTSTTSSALAATPTAVKAAYDLANGKVSCDETNVKAVLTALDSSDTLYIGDSGNDATIKIRGNLEVTGTTTEINTTNLTVNDNKIVINKDASSGEDAAIVIEQGSTGADIELIWDQSAGNFAIDSQGVAGTGTHTGAYITTNVAAGDNTAPSALSDGKGKGSMYTLTNGDIYIYS